MSEVLTQSQIDALVNAMKSGGDVEPETKKKEKYKKYDFYSPKKFTKDKLRLLSGIYENYARLCSSRINNLVRLSSFVEVLEVEEQRYYEFSNALNDNDILTLIDVKLPDETVFGPVILHCTNQLILGIIDRMIGGTGDDTRLLPASYVLTDIELALYEDIVKYLISAMSGGWSNYLELVFTLDKVDTNPAMMQRIGRDETIVIVVMEVEIGSIKGKINICLPSDFLIHLFKIFDEKPQKSADDEETKEIFDGIKETDMEMVAELGRSTLLLKDLFNLQVGDVINLNKQKDSDVLIYIGNEKWFKGKLGKCNRNLAVKLNEVYEKK